jgi:hypothetical protein
VVYGCFFSIIGIHRLVSAFDVCDLDNAAASLEECFSPAASTSHLLIPKFIEQQQSIDQHQVMVVKPKLREM